MGTLRLSLSTTLLAAAVLATGCATSASDEPTDALTAERADGLDISSRGEDHVAGRYSKDGTTIAFEFTRRGDVREARLETAAGAPLFTATYKDGVETLTALGGRVTVSGAVSSTEPQIVGDREALRELNEMPESQLVAPLRAALSRTGLERDLFVAFEEGKLGTRAMGRDYTIPCGQFNVFPTWSFWLPSDFRVRNQSATSNAVLEFRSLSTFEYLVVPMGGTEYFRRYYWGFSMQITNLCWWGNAPITVYEW